MVIYLKVHQGGMMLHGDLCSCLDVTLILALPLRALWAPCRKSTKDLRA